MKLPIISTIHLSLFLTNQDKCILYESTREKQTFEYLMRIMELSSRYIPNQDRFLFLKKFIYKRCFITKYPILNFK